MAYLLKGGYVHLNDPDFSCPTRCAYTHPPPVITREPPATAFAHPEPVGADVVVLPRIGASRRQWGGVLLPLLCTPQAPVAVLTVHPDVATRADEDRG